jgi:hypothetical protein
MVFPFVELPAAPAPAFPNRTSIKRPMLQLSLHRGSKVVSTFAIVDSGADECIFPASLGMALGVPIPNPNVYVFSGTAEQPQNAYFDNVRVAVWQFATPSRVAFEFELYRVFATRLNILGSGYWARMVSFHAIRS